MKLAIVLLYCEFTLLSNLQLAAQEQDPVLLYSEFTLLSNMLHFLIASR